MNISTSIAIKWCRELSIDMVIDIGIFKNDMVTQFSCYTSIPKPGMELKQRLVFTVQTESNKERILQRERVHRKGLGRVYKKGLAREWRKGGYGEREGMEKGRL